MDAGEMIRQARAAAGLTQEELARASGTSQATLSQYERAAKLPSAATLARVLAATGRRLTTRPATRPVVTPPAQELEARGRILADVLDLAEKLPARRPGELRFPRLDLRAGS